MKKRRNEREIKEIQSRIDSNLQSSNVCNQLHHREEEKFFQVSSFPSTEEKTALDDDEIVLSLEKLANSITKRGRSL